MTEIIAGFLLRIVSHKGRLQGALFRSSAFAVLLLSITACAANDVPATRCAADRIDERVSVEHLYDGDTVKLSDGRKLRFIGINTPEIDHHGTQSQPLASAARDALQDLLRKSNHTLGLRYDAERHDRYRRDLAHVYLNDGSSVEVHLLERGLATIMPFPPNLWNLACYQATEQRAQAAQRGVWALPEYQPIDAAQLGSNDTGMRLIKGKVTAVREVKRDVWLTLDDAVLLHIGQRDRKYFADAPLEDLPGRTVIARGRLYFAEGMLRMQIRHPAVLQVMP